MEAMMSFGSFSAYRFSLFADFSRPAAMPVAIRTDEGIRRLDGPDEPAAETGGQVLDALREKLAAQGVDLPGAEEAEAFTPERVAERVLGAIQARLDAAADPQARADLLAAARSGVQQGLAEAREALDALGALTGEVAAGIDRTEGLLLNGLDALEAADVVPLALAETVPSGGLVPLEGAASPAGAAAPTAAATDPAVGDAAASPVAGGEPAAGTGAAFLRQESLSASRSTSIQIRTREGDLVTIDLSLSVARSRSLVAAGNGDTTALAYRSSRSVDFSMNFSIQGDLNEEEREAIGDLLERIDKVTDKFFDGKVDAAFAKLSELEVDGEAIAGYALSLEQTVSRQALTAYAAAGGASAAPADGAAQVAGGYASEVGAVLDQGAATLPFEAPRPAAGRLMEGMFGLKAEEHPDAKPAVELMEDLLEKLAGEKDGDD